MRAMAFLCMALAPWSTRSIGVEERSNAERRSQVTVAFELGEAGGLRHDGVVTVGLSFPHSTWDGSSALFVSLGGRRSEAQVRVLSRHVSNAVRTAAVTFPARVRAGHVERGVASTVPGGVDRQAERLVVEVEHGTIRVDTGRIRVHCDAAGFALESVHGPGRTTVKERAQDGATAGRPEVEIEDQGPWKVVVRQHGRVIPPGMPVAFDMVRRLTCTAGEDVVIVETWFESDVHFGRLPACELLLECGFEPREFWTDAGRAKRGEGRGPVTLEAGTGERSSLVGEGFDADLEPGCADGLALVSGDRVVGVAVRDFRRLTPGWIVSAGERDIRVTLVSEAYHWWPGVRAGRAVKIACVVGGGAARQAATWFEPVARQAVRRTAAFVHLDDVRAASLPSACLQRLEQAIMDTLAPASRARFGLEPGGEEDSGDFRWSRSDFGNLEYDTSFGLAHWALRTGDLELLWRANRAVRHLLMRDLDLAGTGLPLRHGAYHRKGGIEAGHMWVRGVLAALDRTGDPFFAEGVDRLHRAWLAWHGRDRFAAMNVRSLAWGLDMGLAFLEHFGTVADTETVRGFQSAIAGAPGPDLPLVEAARYPEGAKFVSTWVVGGLLLDVVDRSLKVLPHDGLAARRRRLADRLIEASFDPATGAYRAALVVDEASGKVIEHDGECSGEEALFFIAGLLRTPAGRESAVSSSRLTELAAAAVADLRLVEKTYRGMEVSQLLWLWPRLAGGR